MNSLTSSSGEAGSTGSYALGHSDWELKRLSIQARLTDPITRRFFLDAGLAPGMRVLDVGSGAGDVAFLVAEIVGAEGTVIGTDRSATALASARERAAALSLHNVSFREGDPAEMTFEQPFDAMVGRYVLMFQPDPTTMLRKLTAHVRQGGVVVFHEPDRDGVRSFPTIANYQRGTQMIDETFRASKGDPRMGIHLYQTFIAAGLPAPTLRLEAIIGSSEDHVHYEMDLVRTLKGEIERFGIRKAGDPDPETLAEEVLAEVIANNGIVTGRSEIGAWSRVK